MIIDPKFQSSLSPEQLDRLINGNPAKIGEGGVIFSGAARASYVFLHEKAKPVQGSGKTEGKFRLDLCFPHSNIGVLVEAVKASIRQHYPAISDPTILMDKFNKNQAAIKDQGLQVAIADGGRGVGKSSAGYVPGFPYIRPSSTQTVPCYTPGPNGQPVAVVIPEDIKAAFYSGVWVTVKMVLLKSTSSTNPGVFWGLQSVMKLANDTRITSGGGPSGSADDFQGTVAIEDPNAGGVIPATTSGSAAAWD